VGRGSGEAQGRVGPTRGRGRITPLDGLRGVALVAVLAYHVAPTSVPGGFLGVESFFVLSGYLLTALLLDERRRTGTIDPRAYAVRRLWRIAPALVVLLAALVVFVPLVAPDDAHRLRGDALSSVVGVTNWHLVAEGSSYFHRFGRPSFVRHLWSVAVEIQFYVLCPFLVAWLARRPRRAAIRILAAGVGLSAAVMGVLYRSSDPSRAYYGTDARMGALLAGGLLAVVLATRRGQQPRRRVWPRPLVTLGPVALVALVSLFLLADDRSRLAYPVAFLATQAVTATMIAAALHPGPLAALLARRELRWLGLRSYGIYLWHWPAVVLLRPGIDVGLSPAVAGAATIGIALVLGAISYRLVERPLLRPRPRAPARARPAFSLAMALVVVAAGQFIGLLVRLPTRDPLAETLRAGQLVLAAQAPPTPVVTTSTTSTTTATTTAVPTTTDAAAVPAVPAPPQAGVEAPASPPPPQPGRSAPAGVRVTAIGDSVMVSAAGALHARVGRSGYVDAQNRRQFSDAIAIAKAMREEGLLSDVVVVHLGNNGPVKGSDVDALMGELADVPTVLLVNVRVHASWQDSVNQTLADAARRHPTITLVDWHGYSDGHRDWFQRDGTHFRTTSGPGANAYADLIAGSIPEA
jgi:peptidoglycan/LPS O-acetylase OafA/YrhL